MNSWLILAVVVVVVAVVGIARAVRPGTGRRRAALPRVEALHRFEAHCPIQRRPTPHVRLALGGAMCLDCRPHIATATTKGDQ